MATLEFSDDEIKVILRVASLFEHAEMNRFGMKAVVDETGLPEETVEKSMRRLRNLGFLEEFDQWGSFCVSLTVLELRDKIENPPLTNHWKDLADWWFSKRWSLPFSVVVVVLPLLAQWVEMLKAVTGWFTAE